MDLSGLARIESDVLVIGSGLAGLYAALCAAKHAKVAVITKSALDESNSSWAQGGIAAAVSSEDSPSLHIEDTLQAGRGLCNEKAVEILAQEGPERIKDLGRLGVLFDRNEEGLDLGKEGGHSRRRILHANGNATGKAIISTLVDHVRSHVNIRVFERVSAVELLSDGERCFGALAYDLKNRTPKLFLAQTTILATGGAAGLYARTTNPPTATGDGVALAYRAGAEIMDMEFVQFHPTALYSPNGHHSLLISEAVRGEGAYLLNRAHKRFMPDYHELGELAPRDVVAHAIYREMRKSGAEFVFLSLRHLGADFVKQRFSNIYRACLEQGLDITRDLVPVAPAAHYTIGGVRTDLDGRTNLEGLLACGEVACTGVHGANRLASNSLLECVVFAHRAAEASLQVAKLKSLNLQTCKLANLRTDCYERLAHLMTEYVGIVRSQAGLSRALKELDELWELYGEKSLEWRNRLLVARLISQAALLRTESRGVHVREDFPSEDPNWRKHIVFKKGCEPQLVCL